MKSKPKDPTKIFSKNSNWLIQSLVLIGMIYLLMVIVQSSNKGVDWTDEAWVHELNTNLSLQQNQTWGFQYFGHIFVLLTGGNLLTLRLLRLVLFVGINYVLSLEVAKYSLGRKFTLTQIRYGSFLTSLLSVFFAYSYFPRSFGYNEMGAWVSALIVFIYIRLWKSRDSQKKRPLVLLLLSLGILNSSLIFIKFTSGFILVLISVLYVAILLRNRARIQGLFCFAIGLLVIPLVIHLLTGQVAFYFSNIYSVLASSDAQSEYLHSVDTILPMYLSQFKLVLWAMFKLAIFPFAVMFVVARVILSQSNDLDLRALSLIAYLSGLGLLLFEFPIQLEDKWTSIGNFTISLMVLSVGFLVILFTLKEIAGFELFIMTLLCLLPFIQAFGTSNPIGGQTMIGNVGIFIVTLSIICKLLPYGIAISFAPILVTCFTLAIAPSLIHGNTTGMYRIDSSVTLNSKISGIPELEDILVSEKDKLRYDWIAQQTSNLSSSSIFIPLTTPGYNFAINNRGFGAAWTDTWWPVSFSNIKFSCEQQMYNDRQVVLVGPQPIAPLFIESLNEALLKCGLTFPTDFSLHGTDPTDSVKIWIWKPNLN
jgi:hypothetical protein